ncbi:DUF5703 family protein [Actinopolymorpha pittospori]|uniref:Dihydroorotate dehydrogenase n=1 Tax=Actinopolymorpha pittospori TaxID=648752 RepID=A0A927N5H8_9ACTN|nr:DUF5703 family protein [Actinopolymorpha pittospori]MBE1610633.1 hypothetical protein [Actinopolymorpha pittospori]
MAEYETHQVQLSRTLSRRVVRQFLVERAEYGGWELSRVRVYPDGRRTVTLRRRIIRVTRTGPVPGGLPL